MPHPPVPGAPAGSGRPAAPADALVGIVVVSHSNPLARSAVSLASEMVHDRPVRLAIAAGLDDATLGTDAMRIKQAIEDVDGPAGVVVLMDLGSAVLSAELAIELLEDSATRERVLLSAAPLVEGLVVAAVAAAGGASRSEVAAEAQNALLGKAAQLAPHPPPGLAPITDDTADLTATFVVANVHGLHARPAARLVSELRGLDAQVRLRNRTTGSGAVPATSLSRVATLAALQGHEIEVAASGPQAGEAVDHLLALAARQFDESSDDLPSVPALPATGPLAASPGIGIGPVRLLSVAAAPPAEQPAGPPAAEWRRVVEALATVRREIERLKALAAREVGAAQAQIFDAHLMLLADSELLDDIKGRIADGIAAVPACVDALAAVEKQWSELPDPYLRARAEDVRAVAVQLATALTGSPATRIGGAGIVVAKELSPGMVAELDPELVQGIVLAESSPTSHAAILARSRGIPAVVGAGPEVLQLAEGQLIVVDGTTGTLLLAPSDSERAGYERQRRELAEVAKRLRRAALAPATTTDGRRVEVAANIATVADAESATSAGADSAGLVRTEFLFLDRDSAPSVETQLAQYRAIGTALAGRRVTLRTLDVGGDKPLAYLPVPPEANPFLGLRGIRLCLARQELLVDQLAAVCAAAREVPTDVMFPMVSNVGELRQARALLEQAAGDDGLPESLRVGIMVEVPAAALTIEQFLPYLDFVSVGTNDLTQYALATERGNPMVASLFDPLHPAVLALVRLVGRACAGRIPVAVCGEAASDPLGVPLLLGLGVTELSVSPAAIPAVKDRVRSLSLSECTALAETAVTLADAAAVRELVAQRFPAG